jgi:hypothetical protein
MVARAVPRDGIAWKLASLADHHEATPQAERQRRGHKEAARFDADKKIRAVWRDHFSKLLDDFGPSARMRQQRRYVVKQYSRFGKIGNFTDMILQSYRHEEIAAMASDDNPAYWVASFR